MVLGSLTLGAVVGVLFSAAFLYFEVGRYATPQVPVTLFDERKELFAYTAGLFVGVPLAIAFVLFQIAMGAGALPSAFLCLALLVVGDEVAQWALLRTRFWGREAARPFYVLSYRAAIGGIISLAIVAQYLSSPTITVDGTALVLLESLAIVALQVAGSFLSLPSTAPGDRVGGSPVAGGLFSTVGFFLLGLGYLGGEAAGTNRGTGLSEPTRFFRTEGDSASAAPTISSGSSEIASSERSFGRMYPSRIVFRSIQSRSPAQ